MTAKHDPEGVEQASAYAQRVFRKMIRESKSKKRNEIVFAALYALHQQALATYHVLAARAHRRRLRGIGLISCMVLFAAIAHAQGVRYDDVALLDTGRPVQGATVTVCASGSTGTPCTPTTSIFNDSALSSLITQPGFQSGAQGNFFFYAACGKYDISITGNGITGRTKKDVQIGPCLRMTFTGVNGTTFAGNGIGSYTPTKAITLTHIDVIVQVAPVGCSVPPSITIDGLGSLVTITNSNFTAAAALSNAIAANTSLIIRSNAGTGCSTQASAPVVTVEYRLQ